MKRRGQRTLTWKEVCEIREARKGVCYTDRRDPRSVYSLAKKYKTSIATISLICNGKYYREPK